MSFVLDSSVALTWCFEDEGTPAADALLASVADEGAFAPSLWPLEFVNALWMAERRGRLTPDARRDRVTFLQALPVKLDADTATQAWTATNRLAVRHQLTVYDAAYLELAQRLDVPLATLDKELRLAGNAPGIPLLGMAP